MCDAMRLSLLFPLAAALCAASCSTARLSADRSAPSAPERPAALLLVSKATMTLSVYDDAGRLTARYPIACGEAFGDKRRPGDRRTPEGEFRVQEILDTSRWPRPAEAQDDAARRSPYGPYFIRLLTPPHEGIGIHGTDDDASIGTRSSAGCVRLHDDDLRALLRHVRIGLPVRIEPSEADAAADRAAAEEAASQLPAEADALSEADAPSETDAVRP